VSAKSFKCTRSVTLALDYSLQEKSVTLLRVRVRRAAELRKAIESWKEKAEVIIESPLTEGGKEGGLLPVCMIPFPTLHPYS
jgi:hypothetical protein